MTTFEDHPLWWLLAMILGTLSFDPGAWGSPSFLLGVKTSSPPLVEPLKGPAAGQEWSLALQQKTGLLAIDMTEKHAPAVLKALINIFESALPAGAPAVFKKLKYVRAYSSLQNDPAAAYYKETQKSLNIGGVSSYPDNEVTPLALEKIHRMLAHELGHALIFSVMSPASLQEIATRHGGWPTTLEGASSFYDPIFFTQHPQCLPASRLPEKIGFIPTAYACTNIHEWFAEVFASAIMQRLYETGHAGLSGQSSAPPLNKMVPKGLRQEIEKLFY